MFATVDRIAHGPELSEVNSSVRLKQAKALPNMRTPDNSWHIRFRFYPIAVSLARKLTMCDMLTELTRFRRPIPLLGSVKT